MIICWLQDRASRAQPADMPPTGNAMILKHICRWTMGFAMAGLAGCMPQKQAVTALPAEYATFQFADEIAGLEFDFPIDNIEVRELDGGRQYFNASGVIKNTSDATLKVPTLTMAFKTKGEKIVFLHDVTLPYNDIAPHEVMEVSAHVIGVPKNAKHVEIGWKAGDGVAQATQAD